MDSTGKKLKELRGEIDGIDRQILQLLNRRAEQVRQVVKAKVAGHVPPFDPARERLVVERMKALNSGPLEDQDIEIIMDAFFRVYRSLGRPFTVAYFGSEGTFTHQAALRQFGEKNKFLSCKTIEHVFREVEKERADYGVVPIENSTEGVVTYTIDMFLESEMKITAEILLEIHHYLLSREKRLSAIKTVYSHVQPLAQCRNWLEDNLPRARLVEALSTTAAAETVLHTKGSASIGAEIAAKLYGLNVLASRIEDFRENFTRFLVISKRSAPPSGDDKTSILFSVKDRIGALHDMLVPFQREGLNLTRIESRPSKRKPWEYVFFVDFKGHQEEPKVRKALGLLKRNCVFLKVLGSYPQGS